ncbi:response regulator transcription factor [Zhihengliuella alba]|uniref:Response regulator transcription factor n=1 Tax=Zhihengliuella alba TaxID=547018 RepID=A0ABP7DVP0_9MICC
MAGLNGDARAAAGAPVRVLIVDDEPLLRAGLRMILDGAGQAAVADDGGRGPVGPDAAGDRGPDVGRAADGRAGDARAADERAADGRIGVVGEAGEGTAAVRLVGELRPDLVLMDIRMPGCDGIEAVRRLRAAGSAVRILMLTAYDTDDFVLDALEAGADGFLLKDTPPRDLVAAVRQAAAGTMALSPAVLARLVAVATRHGRRTTRDDPLAGLSEREREVADRVAAGLTNTEIADELYLSVPTVKTHPGRIFAKLGVDNRVQLAVRVLESR